MDYLNDTKAIELEKGLFWLGFADYEAGFSNNPYLLLDEDEAVLFDPGPGHPLFRDLAIRKIQEICPASIIRYVVVHHADPDLCGMLPLLESFIHPEAVIVAHPRSALFLPYYGLRKPILSVGDADALELKSGTRIEFHHTPYVHFAGSMVSFLRDRGILFSSDIFGVFDKDWKLRAGPDYPELARSFLDHYVGDRDSLAYVRELFERLPIRKILPQHGGIIESGIERYLKVLSDAEPGALVRELRSKPDGKKAAVLGSRVAAALASWAGGAVLPTSLAELEAYARDSGPAFVGMLYDATAREAQAMGVANPYTYGRIHHPESMQTKRSDQWMERARRQLLTSQYSMLYGNEDAMDQLLQRRLQAIELEAVVLFIDVRGFTAWSAQRPPDEVIGALNKQHETLARAINASGGRINKIIGDGMLAYFPAARILEALTACLRVQESVIGEKLLPVGVGCELGRVIMGDVGEISRLDFTIIGETVNTASRMCALAAVGEIVLGKAFWDRLPAANRKGLVGERMVKSFRVRFKPTDPILLGVRIYPPKAPDAEVLEELESE